MPQNNISLYRGDLLQERIRAAGLMITNRGPMPQLSGSLPISHNILILILSLNCASSCYYHSLLFRVLDTALIDLQLLHKVETLGPNWSVMSVTD